MSANGSFVISPVKTRDCPKEGELNPFVLARHPVEERGPYEVSENRMDTGLRRYDDPLSGDDTQRRMTRSLALVEKCDELLQ